MGSDNLLAEAIEKCVDYAWEHRSEGVVVFMPGEVLGEETWDLVREKIALDCKTPSLPEQVLGEIFAGEVIHRLQERILGEVVSRLN